MTSRLHKSRPTTAPNASTANKPRVVERIVAVDDPAHPVERLRRVGRIVVFTMLAAGGFAAYLLFTSDVGAAEPQRRDSSSSLRWRMSTKPAGAAPQTLNAEVTNHAALLQPFVDADEPRAKIIRDAAVEPTQAVEAVGEVELTQAQEAPLAADDPAKDPFNDRGRLPAPLKFNEPTSPNDDYRVPRMPDTDRLAQGKNYKQDDCPKLADLKPIYHITNRIAASKGDVPRECTIDDNVVELANRPWGETVYTWKASGLCHKPLYFEQEALERYGHSTGKYTQPFVSAASFWLTVPLLPYKMALDPPLECKYTLGYYRPGSCAPYIIPPVPITPRAVAAETAAVLGLIYILPW
jgi:hypothetical protein